MLDAISDITTPVLKEAIQTTKALAVRYLWIDALCIVQGDLEDWERESKAMGKIYSGAYCTLCALSSRSCLEGFLQRQPVQLSIPFGSKVDPQVKGIYGVRFRNITTKLEVVRYSSMYEDFAVSNWAQRGWTYQEYALSKRIVVFGHSAVHFVCSSGSDTQSRIPDELEEGVDYFQVDHLDSGVTPYMAYNEWSIVAADFSRRLFTYRGDRFPALSGLAQYFGELLVDEYLAGLWKRDLWRGLYWGLSIYVVSPTWAGLLD